jgi:hypothetical protein
MWLLNRNGNCPGNFIFPGNSVPAVPVAVAVSCIQKNNIPIENDAGLFIGSCFKKWFVSLAIREQLIRLQRIPDPELQCRCSRHLAITQEIPEQLHVAVLFAYFIFLRQPEQATFLPCIEVF